MIQPLGLLGDLGTAAIVAGLIVVAAGASLRAFRETGFGPLLCVTGVFAYFVLAPAVYLVLTGDFAYGHADPGTKLARTLGVLLVAYVTLLAGYALGRTLLRRASVSPLDGRPIDSRAVLLFGLAGMAVGVLAFAYFVTVNGGFVRLMTVKPRTAFQTVPETGRYRLLGLMGVFGGWLTTWIALHPVVDDPEESLLSRSGVLLAGTLVVAVAFAILSRERLKILYIVLFGVSYLATTSRVDVRQLAVYGGSLAVLGVSFTAIEQTLIDSARFVDLFHSVLNPRRLEALMEVVAGVPADRPYQDGATYLKTFVSERGKGTMAYGDQVEVLLHGRNAEAIGFSAMIWGEMWLNFGPTGVLVGSGLYGMAIGAVSSFRRGATAPTSRGVSAVLVATVAVALPAASTWIGKVLFVETLLPVLVAVGAAYLVGTRARRTATGPLRR